MTALPAKKLATYEDLLRLPEHVVGEILDGELIVSPRPAPRHAAASSGSGADVYAAFHRKSGGPLGPGGWWILDEPEIHLHRQILVPDVAGWRRERLPALPARPWFELAPDWVCEVISPHSGRRDRIQKARIYREFGVEWYWLIDPLQQTVEVWHGQGERWLVEGVWGGDDGEARMPPFDATPLDLSRWWEGGPPEETQIP